MANRKPTTKAGKPALPKGFKAVRAPKSALHRQLLSDKDVTTNGGSHTLHGDLILVQPGGSVNSVGVREH